MTQRFELGREQEIRIKIQRLYWDEQLFQCEIESLLGVSHLTLVRMMRRLGIITRSTTEANLVSYRRSNRQPCWKEGDLYSSGKRVRRNISGDVRGEHYLVLEQAGIAIPIGREVHHRDGNRSNNLLENLQVVTKSQHQLLHHRQEKGGA